MLCEKCKIRPANVHVTEMINGEVKSHRYCMQCAGLLGIPGQMLMDDFPLARMLAGLLSAQTSQHADAEEYMDIECPVCHTKYSEVAENSRFGCPDCYEVFDLLISDTIKQLQGSDQNKGKRPGGAAVEEIGEDVKVDIARDIEPGAMDAETTEKLMELRRLLKVALADEEYEEAAVYRDQIRELEASRTQVATEAETRVLTEVGMQTLHKTGKSEEKKTKKEAKEKQKKIITRATKQEAEKAEKKSDKKSETKADKKTASKTAKKTTKRAQKKDA